MTREAKRYTITAALPYANGPIHIGQLAGAYLPSDIYARYRKMRGDDTVFICGSDEHGVAITLRAMKEGKTPQEVVDYYHKLNKESFERFGIDFDIFHRTSDPLHHELAQEFFLRLYEEGKFIEKSSEQFYDEEYGIFLADRYIIGTCPRCGYDRAYGDQCEKCGSSLSPEELINPISALSGKAPRLKKTTHWYLPMNEYEGWLRKWILEEHKDDWKKNVLGQVKSWLDQGLQPRAMTRDLDWGVKVPLPEAEGKVLYVWLDAPIGYISATKAWAIENGKDWRPYWQDENTRLIHFIGKDNIVFHCIIFPIILKAHGGYILPDNVPANEFMNMEGEKISTSRNWAVWLHEYLDEFPGKEDVLRYVLTANMPENKDSEFTWKDFQEKNNSMLVGILGNFVNRVLVLHQKYFNGLVQPFNPELRMEGQRIRGLDLEWGAEGFANAISSQLESFKFREALASVMDVARAGNKFLTDEEPWKKIKEHPEEVGEVLHIALQVIANLAIAMAPVMPFSAKKLASMINLPEDELRWENLGRYDLIPSFHRLGKPELLFDKIEDAIVETQIAKLMATKEDGAADKSPFPPVRDEITYEEFMKPDIRVGTILQAEKMKNADKLLKLTVDIGLETRTIVSGIAEYFDPAELPGRQVAVVANLAPRKLRGKVSRGMILMAEDEEGRLSFVAPTENFPNGAVIR